MRYLKIKTHSREIFTLCNPSSIMLLLLYIILSITFIVLRKLFVTNGENLLWITWVNYFVMTIQYLCSFFLLWKYLDELEVLKNGFMKAFMLLCFIDAIPLLVILPFGPSLIIAMLYEVVSIATSFLFYPVAFYSFGPSGFSIKERVENVPVHFFVISFLYLLYALSILNGLDFNAISSLSVVTRSSYLKLIFHAVVGGSMTVYIFITSMNLSLKRRVV